MSLIALSVLAALITGQSEAAPAATASASASMAPPPPSGWNGTGGLSLIWLSGNSQALTLSANINLQKQTENWIYSTKATAIYGQALVLATPGNTNSNTQVVALAAGLSLRGDRRLNRQITAYLAAAGDTDHVKSIEYRVSGEAGSGVAWLERMEGDLTRVMLRTDLGLRYARESRFQYYPAPLKIGGLDFLAPRLGLAYRYALSKEVLFTEDAEILPNIIGDSRYLLNSLSKIAVRLTEIFSFASSFQINHDSSPAIGKEQTDSILTVGLELAI